MLEMFRKNKNTYIAGNYIFNIQPKEVRRRFKTTGIGEQKWLSDTVHYGLGNKAVLTMSPQGVLKITSLE